MLVDPRCVVTVVGFPAGLNVTVCARRVAPPAAVWVSPVNRPAGS